MAMKARGIGGRHHHMRVLRTYQLIDGTRFVVSLKTPFYHLTISVFFSKEMGLYIGSWPIHWLASLAI